MKFMELMRNKAQSLRENKIPTVAFLGDSVTQGCFELYMKTKEGFETEFRSEYAYHNCLKKILALFFPSVPVNIINAGISGDGTSGGLTRLERDVISHNPDLTVVCFGLNDAGAGIDGLNEYKSNLKNIFIKLAESGSEVIFMTPNMMNTYVSNRLEHEQIFKMSEWTMKLQNEGILDLYCEAAKETAKECGAAVCDVYSKWKKLSENGVDTTELLANYINHPIKEMHWLFAVSLIETMMN